MHDIWVVTELVGGCLARLVCSYWEAANWRTGGGKVIAVAMGHEIMPLAQELVEHGVDEVLLPITRS